MSNAWFRGLIGVLLAAGLVTVEARDRGNDGGRGNRNSTLVVTMTNDADANAIQIYDAATHHVIQTVPTNGKGGVSGNARGIRAMDGLVAAVNYGSNTVAVFSRAGRGLKLDQLIATTSAPVSIDFGNGHMYVAGATTVDSFPVRHGRVGLLDGTTQLQLANGAVPPAGSTAQVGVINELALLVTLKTDPDPGTVDIIQLGDDGAVVSAAPTAVSAPDGTLTPFGFSTYPDGTAVITLAHSAHDGLFRDGAFTETIEAGQAAPCWTTRVGKYVFTANTGSKTISRLLGSGSHLFVDDPVAATIVTSGSPSDVDGDGGVLAVLDHAGDQAHLSLFTYNEFGELTPAGSPIALGAPDANGVAVVAAGDRHDR